MLETQRYQPTEAEIEKAKKIRVDLLTQAQNLKLVLEELKIAELDIRTTAVAADACCCCCPCCCCGAASDPVDN